MIQVRPYQTKVLREASAAITGGYRRPLVVMPTGSGKTYVFAIIAMILSNAGKKVCILVHRSYLIEQVAKSLRFLGVEHGVIAPGYTKTNYNIQVASVDTLVRRLDQYEFDRIICDEAHHVDGTNKWAKVFNYYDTVSMGFTATASRTSGAGLGVKSGGYFDILIQGPQILEITPDFLSPIECFAPKNMLNRGEFHTLGGDFNRKELAKATNQKKIYGNVPLHYMNICNGVPAVAFCVSIEHAHNVAEHFKSYKIPATYISGKCSKDRRKSVLTGFSQGIYDILCSCDLISEGFDVPKCGASILLRPTKSLVLFMQQCGRPMRIAPGKKCAYIIDHVGNVGESGFGLPDEDRVWSLDGITKKRTNPSRGLVVCPNCCRQQYATRKCIHCGYEFGKKKSGRGDLETDEEATLQKIESAHQKKEAKKLKLKEMMANAESLKDFHVIAKEMGYKHTWAWHVYQSRQKRKLKQEVV